jgi:hypothetical protein
MTGFMHCNQRVKQGIWIDRLIIGLILYSCFFLTHRRVGTDMDSSMSVCLPSEERGVALLTFALHRVRCQALWQVNFNMMLKPLLSIASA